MVLCPMTEFVPPGADQDNLLGLGVLDLLCALSEHLPAVQREILMVCTLYGPFWVLLAGYVIYVLMLCCNIVFQQ